MIHYIAQLSLYRSDAFEAIQANAITYGRDFYTLVAALALWKPLEEVTPYERAEVKNALFFWAYSARPADVYRALTALEANPFDRKTVTLDSATDRKTKR